MKMRLCLFAFLGLLVWALTLSGCSQGGTETKADAAAAQLEQNARDVLAAYSDHDVDKILSLMAENVETIDEDGGVTTGKETMRENLEGLFKSFPDFKMEPVAVFAKGNRVCSQWHASGTASGAGPGEEAMAGKTFSVPGVTVSEWEGDKSVRATLYMNMATVLAQLGVIPPPPAQQ
jgi:steroid delta-isomerase-like uncharacterized protein